MQAKRRRLQASAKRCTFGHKAEIWFKNRTPHLISLKLSDGVPRAYLVAHLLHPRRDVSLSNNDKCMTSRWSRQRRPSIAFKAVAIKHYMLRWQATRQLFNAVYVLFASSAVVSPASWSATARAFVARCDRGRWMKRRGKLVWRVERRLRCNATGGTKREGGICVQKVDCRQWRQ